MNELSLPIGERDNIWGNPKAGISLLEYGEFEGQYCKEAFIMVQRIQQERGESMSFVFRNFPLSQIHPHAQHAAFAAEAAARQGRFWEMEEILFKNQNALEDSDLLHYAVQIGLNLTRFSHEMGSEEVAIKVHDDFMSGVKSGVSGTPTFFVNGWKHQGPYNFATLLRVVERGGEEAPW
ncbi:thioredoxin domain-containing protein [Patescibacteria group bacterium]|nr:thioredoxin domain-containing protein [Patescibacteria group bacterium]